MNYNIIIFQKYIIFILKQKCNYLISYKSSKQFLIIDIHKYLNKKQPINLS